MSLESFQLLSYALRKLYKMNGGWRDDQPAQSSFHWRD